eukprot:CAMPEP_0181222704 /NCGR_PEP_ID=MMETSP1096-20121128/30111_1 /TAXON_ID=156174 ORGANISM="Chrysochromulina ericina, Strain CCMP281" /NCGR_SAMPLE_ID=MMETSP1096 /ASSEMBLY_ACC=CAM_ASM_000453 /LENGTH=223 /DNA_ID=CAMNT_0023315489 /DNA_START=306 /DNA_END=973 /DNA_ORIENTATION=-
MRVSGDRSIHSNRVTELVKFWNNSHRTGHHDGDLGRHARVRHARVGVLPLHQGGVAATLVRAAAADDAGDDAEDNDRTNADHDVKPPLILVAVAIGLRALLEFKVVKFEEWEGESGILEGSTNAENISIAFASGADAERNVDVETLGVASHRHSNVQAVAEIVDRRDGDKDGIPAGRKALSLNVIAAQNLVGDGCRGGAAARQHRDLDTDRSQVEWQALLARG